MARDQNSTYKDDDYPARSANVDWWAEEDAKRSGSCLSVIVSQIRNRHRWRYDADILHAGLYAGNANAGGVIMTPGGDFSYMPSTKPRNIVRMGVDTYMARSETRPLPKVQTTHGNWRQQKRARKMSQFIQGAYSTARFFQKKAPMIRRDSAIFSRGIAKICREGKKGIAIERVFPWEFLVDEWDARYEQPSNTYQIRTLDLGRALALWGKKKEDEDDEEWQARRRAIRNAATTTPTDEWTWEGEADTTVVRVRVVEAYHLCDDMEAHKAKEKHDCTGTCDIAILGGPRLERYEFDWPEHPFEVLYYSEPLAGMLGMGLGEQLEGWQEAIDVQHETLENCFRTVGGAMFIVDNNADIPKAKFQSGGVVVLQKRPGSNVQVVNPSPVNAQVFERERSMPGEALSEFGFTPQSTQGQKPAGITAAVAIQAFETIQDQRMQRQAALYEEFCAGVARKCLLVARDIATDEGEFEVQVPMKTGLLPIKWSDVELDDFQVMVTPTSWLPTQFGAKLDVLKSLFDAQLVDRSQFLYLLGGPDYEWELDLETADRLNIDEKLEAICDAEDAKELEAAEYQATPSNYQDPAWAQRRAQQRYNKGQSDGLPQANQEALLRFIQLCEAILAPPTPEPMPMTGEPGMPPGMGAPPGMGMPPGGPPPVLPGMPNFEGPPVNGVPQPGLQGPPPMPPPSPGGSPMM
jgi:hypothetical protein